MLFWDKVDFMTKWITKDLQKVFVMIKHTIHQEDNRYSKFVST